ncbi:S8 family serine peptidase [Flavihumibacter sp. ZG627]|uniref:S8 family serine peptidase n=1 Tax=Flavihumibacter sp. ZG627 TaxID=1463156 RepID=UPI0006950905|nr:S8 family serine peptidase [Flavihumibacter sp. ZG627]
MDPALHELIGENLDPGEEIDAIIRLHHPKNIPPGITVISSFGEIITCRLKRRDVTDVYKHPFVISMKAPRLFFNDAFSMPAHSMYNTFPLQEGQGNSIVPALTGKGVVIGIIDWGCDFAHIDFLDSNGNTRLLALWDQSSTRNKLSPEPYGYGRYYTREAINKALKTSTPYSSLGYHPGTTDRKKQGMHGTHVMGIAASNGRSGNKGIAPGSEIVFVHLGTGNTSGQYNLGDSVSILEAIDFIKKKAGNRKLVINLSVGKHGGPHDGTTLVEMGIDRFLEDNNNTVICQSTGNYFRSRTHCSGLIKPADKVELSFITGSTRIIENEVEVWYSGWDEFSICLRRKGKQQRFTCALNHSAVIYDGHKVAGRIYHRSKDPNNGRNHVDIFLYPNAPLGEWILELEGIKITDGRYHAWIERADNGQSVFSDANIVHTSTTNTICNSNNAIVVGAYDSSDPASAIASFSSSGPTLDGRIKPLFLAPGLNILSAKSTAADQPASMNHLTKMSGTSMAAPFVTGIIALLLEGIHQDASIHDVRNMLCKTCRMVPRKELAEQLRGGYGVIDTGKVEQTIRWFNSHTTKPSENESSLPDAAYDNGEFYECGLNEFSVADEALTHC